MTRLMPLFAALAALTGLAAAPAEAGLFKCKSSDGTVIYSDEPCEKQGARKEKAMSKAEMQGNQMRMRPRPPQGDGSAPQFGSGSSYRGNAPSKGGTGDPRNAPPSEF